MTKTLRTATVVPATGPPPPPTTARERCYQGVVQLAKEGLARYYAEYSERLGDERSNEAVAWSTRGVQRILRFLDGFLIEELPDHPKQAASPEKT